MLNYNHMAKRLFFLLHIRIYLYLHLFSRSSPCLCCHYIQLWTFMRSRNSHILVETSCENSLPVPSVGCVFLVTTCSTQALTFRRKTANVAVRGRHQDVDSCFPLWPLEEDMFLAVGSNFGSDLVVVPRLPSQLFCRIRVLDIQLNITGLPLQC